MNRKKKMTKMTKFVITSMAVLILYTVTAFVAIFNDKQPSDVLTVCIYSAFTGELAGLMFKKINDKKDDKKKNLDIGEE